MLSHWATSNTEGARQPWKALAVAEEQHLLVIQGNAGSHIYKDLAQSTFQKLNIQGQSVSPPQKPTINKQDETGVITFNKNVLYLYKA